MLIVICIVWLLVFQGNLDDALAVYEQAIAIEKGKEHSQALPVLFAQYARFLYLVGLLYYKFSAFLTI